MRSLLLFAPILLAVGCTDGDDPTDVPEDGYISVDGSGSVSVTYNAANTGMPFGTDQAFTFRARFQGYGAFQENFLVSIVDQFGGTQVSLGINSAGSPFMRFSATEFKEYASTTVLATDDGWHTLGLTWDPAVVAPSARATLWVDGAPVASDIEFNLQGTASFPGLPSDGTITAGAAHIGAIDDIQIFAGAKTAAELGNNDAPPDGAVLTWDMDVEELVTTKLIPNVGSGTTLDGTALGGVTAAGTIGGGGGGCSVGCNPGI